MEPVAAERRAGRDRAADRSGRSSRPGGRSGRCAAGWAKRIDRPGVMPTNGELGIMNREYVTTNRVARHYKILLHQYVERYPRCLVTTFVRTRRRCARIKGSAGNAGIGESRGRGVGELVGLHPGTGSGAGSRHRRHRVNPLRGSCAGAAALAGDTAPSASTRLPMAGRVLPAICSPAEKNGAQVTHGSDCQGGPVCGGRGR